MNEDLRYDYPMYFSFILKLFCGTKNLCHWVTFLGTYYSWYGNKSVELGSTGSVETIQQWCDQLTYPERTQQSMYGKCNHGISYLTGNPPKANQVRMFLQNRQTILL